MVQVRLSKEAIEAGRKFFAEHPVFEMEQLREIAVEGPGGEMIRVVEGRCQKCGFTLSPADNPMLEEGAFWPADTLKAVKLTHAWDRDTRSKYCGGEFRLLSAPVI